MSEVHPHRIIQPDKSFPAFTLLVAAAHKLQPGYQIARLRIRKGLTQAQLAELVGTSQPSIARVESCERMPSLSLLQRVAEVLDARIEVRLVPMDTLEG